MSATVTQTNRRSALHGIALAMCAAWLPSGTPAAVTEHTHGPWTVRCEGPDADERECIMFQNLVLKTGGQPVLQFAVGYAPSDGTPTVILSLPLGISLPPGITMRIDDGTPANFPVERCEPDGCQAGMKLRAATITRLSEGDELTITFHDGEREPITVPLSLDGFGEGFDALTALRDETGAPTPGVAP